jgi:gluconate kinase
MMLSTADSNKSSGTDGKVAVTTLNSKLYVIFGRPGAGKTSLANAVIAKIKGKCFALDLDCCVPQWMRDNFAKGTYPTVGERADFISSACDYVEAQHRHRNDQGLPTGSCIISFSFVNEDIRSAFRSRFPSSTWLLMETPQEEAAYRVKHRTNHFYKGQEQKDTSNSRSSSEDDGDRDTFDSTSISQDKARNTNLAFISSNDNNNTIESTISNSTSSDGTSDESNNSEWEFAPVVFPVVRLDGTQSVEINVKAVLCAMAMG